MLQLLSGRPDSCDSGGSNDFNGSMNSSIPSGIDGSSVDAGGVKLPISPEELAAWRASADRCTHDVCCRPWQLLCTSPQPCNQHIF
jgi:hypothetical protein